MGIAGICQNESRSRENICGGNHTKTIKQKRSTEKFMKFLKTELFKRRILAFQSFYNKFT